MFRVADSAAGIAAFVLSDFRDSLRWHLMGMMPHPDPQVQAGLEMPLKPTQPVGATVHRAAAWCLGLAVLLLTAAASLAADVWFQDSNLGRARGMPADFVSKFREPETFAEASRYIDVYLVRAKVLMPLEDAFFTRLLFPYLAENGIELAINAGGATWTQASARRHRVFREEIELLQRLKSLGGRVSYVSLQSVLSKSWKIGGQARNYPLERRVEDIVAYAKAAQAIYPDIKVGLIDALPTHGKEYEDAYRRVKHALAAAQINLSYIHLDLPIEILLEKRRGMTWHKLRDVELYVEDELGVVFGLYTTSQRGGRKSSAAFHRRVITQLECYVGRVGGTPGDLILASWFPYPDKTIPDSATGKNYPAMRIVLEYGRKLEEIDEGGPAWSSRHASASQWDSRCNAG